jgi:2-dehydro-3-deoxyphosphooctonate aldolase (KDO 8-P synthase)
MPPIATRWRAWPGRRPSRWPDPVTAVTLRDISIGGGNPFALIAGPCVIENENHATALAGQLVEISARVGVPFIFKASFDKANRTSGRSFRGPGLQEGLRVLAAIKARFDIPLLTDIHEPDQADPVADVVDVLQIPAFLSRQTDLIVAAARTGRVVNIKKGQFLGPEDIRHAVAKVQEAGNSRVIVTERGTSFGYNNLIVDMRGFPIMRSQGFPVVFDVTHSLQLPGAGDGITAGLAQYIEPLASAGVAAGVDGVFLEVHEEPSRARSDAQNALRLDRLEPLLRRLTALDAITKAAEDAATRPGVSSARG